MNDKLKGKKVAVLATDGFEQSELFEPKEALEKAGAEVSIVSLKSGEIKGWNENDWGKTIAVDLTADKASAKDFDGLVLPGGVINPDKLRINKDAVNFIKEFFASEKPVAAICHAPWLLINAEAAKGKTLTSWESVKTDLENAGAKWVDREVAVDGNLITSRNPQDIPAFNEKLIEAVANINAKERTANQ